MDEGIYFGTFVNTRKHKNNAQLYKKTWDTKAVKKSGWIMWEENNC